MPDPSPYGRKAAERWMTCQPEEYRKIPEPDRPAFFARLGEQIDDAVSRRAQELMDREEPQSVTGFQARFALLSTLRGQAEQEVLAEMLPAQPQEDPAGR